MNKKNRLLKIGIAAVPTVPMAATAALLLTAALGLPAHWSQAYLPALAGAALAALASWSGVSAVIAAVLAVGAGGGAVALGADAAAAVQMWFQSLASAGAAPDAAALTAAGGLLTAVSAAVLGAVMFGLLAHRGGAVLAAAIELMILIVSCAADDSMSFGVAVPGLIAMVAALACDSGLSRDAGAWRALIPAALAVTLALALLPAQGLTWEPLENAARRVRDTFEDYFRFTRERVPFTISTEGYNHAAEVDGEVTVCLGGPAVPDTDAVMRVTSDADVLLRGTIRRTYTGLTWTDSDAKARYLYYDFTRSGLRDRMFGASGNAVFAPVRVEIEMLGDGTSSLFVPTRMDSFDMTMETAVHYNTIGEIFLSRPVRAGDSYSLTGYQPSGEALRAAVTAAQDRRDGGREEILDACTQLPNTIEEGVYALAVQLTRDKTNAWDKADAIQRWLRNNCAYTLTPDYPDHGRDFVSQFVLDTREGYCSYFASAMTVMCRIAGLPARYVEGYLVPAGEDVVITGENAHAWTEVYFNGLGWVAFDASNGGQDGDDGLSDEQNDPPPTEAPESGDPDVTPEPEDGSTPPPPDQPTPTPTLPPENDAQNTPEPTADPFVLPSQQPPASTFPPRNDASGDGFNLTWLWILLAVLFLLTLILLAVMLIRARLAANDPGRLSARAQDAQQAMLIMYRSILTLLAVTGQAPLSGETPGAFARRICAGGTNPDFVLFADSVAMSVYARQAATRQTVEAGRRAYAVFLKGLSGGQRFRFAAVRLTRGLGRFESIP